jgi:predicted RNA-binding protein with PIN domain
MLNRTGSKPDLRRPGDDSLHSTSPTAARMREAAKRDYARAWPGCTSRLGERAGVGRHGYRARGWFGGDAVSRRDRKPGSRGRPLASPRTLSGDGAIICRTTGADVAYLAIETVPGSGFCLTILVLWSILTKREQNMPVLIDGNNLLFAALENDPERPPSRSTLCRLLGQWARRTGEQVAVIFDGPEPTEALAGQISDPDVAVTYSAGPSADDVLARTLDAHSAARRLIVVSSDREVARAARRRKARSVRSDVFWAVVQRDLARERPRPLEPPEKRRGLKPDDAEHWLRELGLGGEQPDGEPDGR